MVIWGIYEQIQVPFHIWNEEGSMQKGVQKTTVR